MIQAPQTQYMPQQNPLVYNNQSQGVQLTTQNPQPQPGVIYNYPTASSYTPYASDKSQFNGVNIEILNPQGVGSPQGAQYTMPAQYVPIQQPVMTPIPQAQPLPQPVPSAPVAEPVQNVNVPAPQIQPVNQEQAPQASTPVVEQQQAPQNSINPESFAGKLKTNDIDAQKNAIEEVAELVKNDDNAGPILLDTQIFDALVDIINKDNSQLEGPSPEVLELRNKPEDQLTEEEKAKALNPSELEKAEMNKQYALYTISYMQERLNNELEKRNGQALELKDLPCIETVIDAAKSNQNPMIRTGAIAALAHIAKPEYANDLKTIFELAESDEDERVKEAAIAAKESLPGAENKTDTQEAKADDSKTEEPKAEEDSKAKKKDKADKKK